MFKKYDTGIVVVVIKIKGIIDDEEEQISVFDEVGSMYMWGKEIYF